MIMITGEETSKRPALLNIKPVFELQMSQSDRFRPQEANKEEFELNSMRCGRKLTKDGDVSWTLAFLLVFKPLDEMYDGFLKCIFTVLLAMDRV